MKQKIIIHTEEHRARAIEIIKSLSLEPVYEVDIRGHKKDRSLDQNALYWKWLTIIGNELGESKEDIHERYKDRFLVNIFERDNPDYAEMVKTLRDVYRQGMHKEALGLRKQIVALTSTTHATVPQMTEYLNNIESHAMSLAIRLPHIED